jgi:hypothetical protein
MRKALSFFALVCSTQLGFAALAAEKATINRRTGLVEPPVSELRKAAERGDRAELSRAATRMGPARLARLLGESDRKLVRAALEAAPLLESGVLLLEPMAPLLSAADEGIRGAAVVAAATLFARTDPSRLAEYEVDSETVAACCRALAVAAAREDEQLGTRLSAIQGLLDAGPACSAERKLDTLFASASPDIRRAAVLAVPGTSDARTQTLIRAASKDSDARVAAAATARLCSMGEKPAALPPLHTLVLSEAALAEDVIDILPCLTASADPTDQKALATLAGNGRPPIREAIKHLRETPPSRPIAETPAKKP